MRSGSPAHDDHGWPSSQRPYGDEAASGPVRYGPGPGGDPHQVHGGRQDVPFGPEISWPNGFRPLDPASREVLETAYGAPGYGQGAPQYRADEDARPYGAGLAHQQSAVDDYGYGDPGYSHPSYEGPRNLYPGPSFPAGSSFPGGSSLPGTSGSRRSPEGPAARQPDGYHVPEIREPPRPAFGYQRQDFAAPPGSPGSQEIYPVTGAQEALPDTGQQPLVGHRSAYPDEWSGHPSPDHRVPDEPRYDNPRASDPRLEGLRYDELRYDEPGGLEYQEPLDDESWYQELRRSAPTYPHGAGDERRGADLPDPGYGREPGYPQGERGAGYGPGRDDGAGPGPQPGTGPGTGYGGRPDTGGPWMNASMQPEPGHPPFPQDLTAQETGFLSAPTAQVGVLTPPAGTPVDDLADDGPFLAGPSAAPYLRPPGHGHPAPAVRPGHGLDGPEITSSWPAQPSSDGLDVIDEIWQEDDGESDYSRLFGDEPDDAGARFAAKRRTGRRRGRSNDHRLWLGLGGVLVVTAAAITGIIKFEFPSHSGPAHAMVTPAKIGTYVRTVALERRADVAGLRSQVIKMSSGQASRVVSAVYESGDSAAGSAVQIVMFVGGHLANGAPSTSITSFTQQFPGARVVSAGPMGGQAACVEEAAGTADGKSICVWFDNDSFGLVVSPTTNAAALPEVMRTIRPSVELVVRK